MTRLRGSAIVEGDAAGAAMVTPYPLAFSLVDPGTGIVRQPNHPWLGRSIAGRVLCFPTGTGSSSGSYWLLNLSREGTAPAAIVNTQSDAVIVAGAVLGDIPLVHRVAPDPLTSIVDGDWVRIGKGGVIVVELQAEDAGGR